MARALVVEKNGRTARFSLSVVSRAKLYGEKKKVLVDEHDRPTTAGWLTIDGAMLIGPGGRAELYLDDDFDVIERDQLAAIDDEGRLLEKLPSTLDTPQDLTPVPPEALLEVIATNVYALSPDGDELEPELIDELKAGAVYRTSFSYMPGYARSPLFLVHNDEGLFAIVAEPAPLEPLSRELSPSAPSLDEDDLDDDLDFTMF